MAYKKDQGRYARMTAFWALFLLAAYGCLGGLVIALRGWIGGEAWADPLPLIGEVDTAKVLGITILAVFGFVLYRFLERPKVADMLIETEDEMRKVTWPTGKETANGSIAVMVTVVVMLVYLTFADALLAAFLPNLQGAA